MRAERLRSLPNALRFMEIGGSPPYLDCTVRPVKLRLSRVAVALTAAALGALFAPVSAGAETVRIEVVPELDLEKAARDGAVGLLVPGWGDTVSREGALAALEAGRVTHPELGGPTPPVVAVGETAGEGQEVVIRVVLPPEGEHENDARYPVAVSGGGFTGLLRSPSTRIPGLVSVADVAPTALALAGDPVPGTVTGNPLSSRPTSDAAAELESLDGRLGELRDGRFEATAGYAALALGLVAVALLTGSRTAGRGALVALPAAATASLAVSLAGSGSWELFLAVTVALTAAGAALRSRGIVAAALAGVLLFHYAVLVAEPVAVSLSLLGPNPDAGGRFYGVSNELETILAGTGIVAAALAWERLHVGGLIAVGGLTLVTVTPGRLGASVAGAIVVTVGLAVLALDLEGRRGLLAVAVAAGAAGAALLLASPDQLSGDPGRLVDRLELSARLAADSTESILLVVLLGVLPLGVLAWRYRALRAVLEPADAAALLALLVVTPVSLFLNDSPQAVLTHGAGWCLAVTAWGLTTSPARSAGGSYTLAPVWVALPLSRPRR
jgi:hypothetical protein